MVRLFIIFMLMVVSFYLLSQVTQVLYNSLAAKLVVGMPFKVYESYFIADFEIHLKK